MFFDINPYRPQSIDVEISPFGVGVSDINYAASRCKKLTEIIDNLFTKTFCPPGERFIFCPGASFTGIRRASRSRA